MNADAAAEPCAGVAPLRCGNGVERCFDASWRSGHGVPHRHALCQDLRSFSLHDTVIRPVRERRYCGNAEEKSERDDPAWSRPRKRGHP